MKNRILSLIVLVVVLFSVFAPTVYAHPGKTDGSGGHYDRSTGEYHYHHGYPAHNHRDMDGDGDRDCPYDFDDKTDHSKTFGSGSNTHTSNSGSAEVSSIPKSKYTLWSDLAAFFSSPYGVFCIIAFILEIIIYFLSINPRIDSDVSCLIALVGLLLYVASIPVSAAITIFITLIIIPIHLGIQKLIEKLRPK